ncbi:MAG: two-component system, OmpR family, response regulator [Actinomycetota bacterium]|jgi:DNA-binding response OmpR family regulator|nr:two-component system, OmpR family, response regulator [Actinomycetota bacterium]
MARILIADDDPDIRQLVIYALADEGHAVSVAKNGREAVDQVAASAPELMVLDIMMPELDGYGVLQELQERDIKGTTKVLVLTAKGSDHDWKQGYDLGADRYMTKPFDPEELLNTVNDMLNASHTELEAKREEEQDRANLLSQLESIFGDG